MQHTLLLSILVVATHTYRYKKSQNSFVYLTERLILFSEYINKFRKLYEIRDQ